MDGSADTDARSLETGSQPSVSNQRLLRVFYQGFPQPFDLFSLGSVGDLTVVDS